MNRRQVLGTAGVGALGAMAMDGSAAASGHDRAGQAAAPSENASSPASSFVFPVTRSQPTTYRGGTLRGAQEQNFPVLAGQHASVYFVHLDVDGFREPHWHPTAWELNYVISGQVHWTILGAHGDGRYHNQDFEAVQGDLVFIPQGFFHYFANASSTQPLEVLVIFNTSTGEPNDDIGIVGAFNSMPRDVLAASFGVPPSTFDQVPSALEPVVISSKKPHPPIGHDQH